MRVALFGGRFDPVHNGHVAVAREVLKQNAADELWFVPDYGHQWQPIATSFQDRIAMLLLILQQHMQVSDVAKDCSSAGFTETLPLVQLLRKQNPYTEFVFVGGSDQVESFPRWTHWKEIEKEVTFLIVARAGYPVENLPKNCNVLKDPDYIPLEDSATRVRKLVKEGKSITGLVPEKVQRYIEEHRLYM